MKIGPVCIRQQRDWTYWYKIAGRLDLLVQNSWEIGPIVQNSWEIGPFGKGQRGDLNKTAGDWTYSIGTGKHGDWTF